MKRSLKRENRWKISVRGRPPWQGENLFDFDFFIFAIPSTCVTHSQRLWGLRGVANGIFARGLSETRKMIVCKKGCSRSTTRAAGQTGKQRFEATPSDAVEASNLFLNDQSADEYTTKVSSRSKKCIKIKKEPTLQGCLPVSLIYPECPLFLCPVWTVEMREKRCCPVKRGAGAKRKEGCCVVILYIFLPVPLFPFRYLDWEKIEMPLESAALVKKWPEKNIFFSLSQRFVLLDFYLNFFYFSRKRRNLIKWDTQREREREHRKKGPASFEKWKKKFK